MKTGDTVRDDQGRTWLVGQLLGRGLWGRSYAARIEGESTERVLKVPLTAAELPEGGERLARACQEILVEQARLLMDQPVSGLVAIEGTFHMEDGTPVLVLPRYAASLERRLQSGCSLEEVLRTAVDVVKVLRSLPTPLPCGAHGVLKPANVLLTDRGEVRLSDPATPALRKHLPALVRASRSGATYLAPEVREAAESPPLSVHADTWALALMVYRGAVTPAEGGPHAPDLPGDGLDKAALVTLKDRIHNRLKGELSNPRFHNRLADRAAALLNRALSRQSTPSPPYRFARHDELLARLEEVLALVHPSVTHAGKVLLDRPTGNDSFTTDEDIAFSCTIAATAGVENHEEIATGLAVFDMDRDERLRHVPCSYTVDRHPSGRFRFGFKVSDLAPGSYRARIAFTIRDSGHEPVTAEGRFAVRAAPGYVPPKETPAPAPIPLERPAQETGVTERRPAPVSPPEEPAAAPVVAPPRPAQAPRPAPPTPRPGPVLGRPVGPQPSPPPAAPGQPEPRRPTLGPPEDAPSDTLFKLPTAAATPQLQADAEDLFGGMDDHGSASVSPYAEASRPVPSVQVQVGQDDEADDEPAYSGAGRWTDLPIPGMSDLGPEPEDDDDDELEGPDGDRSGLSETLGRLVELARGEAYWLFIGGAVILILLLLVALLAIG